MGKVGKTQKRKCRGTSFFVFYFRYVPSGAGVWRFWSSGRCFCSFCCCFCSLVNFFCCFWSFFSCFFSCFCSFCCSLVFSFRSFWEVLSSLCSGLFFWSFREAWDWRPFSPHTRMYWERFPASGAAAWATLPAAALLKPQTRAAATKNRPALFFISFQLLLSIRLSRAVSV